MIFIRMKRRNSINIRLPFQSTTKGGVFDWNQDTGQALMDDLLCLMTTKRGSRVMRNSYYSPIFDYLDEPIDDTTEKELKADIQSQVKIFLPQIDILNVTMTKQQDQNLISIKIQFTSKLIYYINKTLIITVPSSGAATTDLN